MQRIRRFFHRYRHQDKANMAPALAPPAPPNQNENIPHPVQVRGQANDQAVVWWQLRQHRAAPPTTDIPQVTSVNRVTHHGPTRTFAVRGHTYQSATSSISTTTTSDDPASLKNRACTSVSSSEPTAAVPKETSSSTWSKGSSNQSLQDVASRAHVSSSLSMSLGALGSNSEATGGIYENVMVGIVGVVPSTSFQPTPTVPIQEYSSLLYHESVVANLDYDLVYLPAGLKILVFGGMMLGALWTVVVWWINFPPSCFSPSITSTRTKKQSVVRFLPIWLTKSLCIGHKDGYTKLSLKKTKKPIDKLSKYASVPRDESEVSSATSALLPIHADVDRTVELKLRKPTGQHMASTESCHVKGGEADRSPKPQSHISVPIREAYLDVPLHSAITPSLTITAAAPDLGNMSPVSAQNPLLPSSPALNTRNSSDWLAQHSAFFCSPPASPYSTSAPDSPRNPLYHSHTRSDSSSTFSTSDMHGEIDVEALEAQVPSTSTANPKTSSFHAAMNVFTTDGRGNKDKVRKSGSGGSWLDIVDGAVSKAVGKVVKWTEDRDGDEGLLLPVTKGDKLD